MKEQDGPQQGREKKSEINGLEEMLFCCCLFVCGFWQGRCGAGEVGGVESRSRPGVTSPIGLDHITGATVHTTYCLKPF